MTNQSHTEISEAPLFTIDAILLTLLFFAGVSAVFAGFVSASLNVLIGGLVAMIVGLYIGSLAKANKLPRIKLPKAKQKSIPHEIPDEEEFEFESPIFTIDALLLTLLFLAGVSAIFVGFISASPLMVIGGLVTMIAGAYVASLAKAKKLPSVRLPGSKKRSKSYDHKFDINQECIFTDDNSSYQVKITHRIVENGDLGYRVETVSDGIMKVIYCSEYQLSEMSDE